jgi:hypothetical protein
MTTQHQIIAICIIVFIAVPVGTFTTIKCIKKLTRVPENTLYRRNDIELVDYIEPSQPLNAYYPNQIDLVNNQFPVLERISYPPTYYTGSNPHFYQSGTLPYYQSVDGININSGLENENIFNSFFTFFIFIILFLVRIFWKMNSLYTMAIMIPFSSFDIDFRDSFKWKFNSPRDKSNISYLKLQSLTGDIIELLNSLKDDENYSLSFSFISSYKGWQDNKEIVHPLWIDDAIIINKESDPILITQFIMKRLNDKGLFITDWLFKDSSINSMDPVILTVTVRIKVKI